MYDPLISRTKNHLGFTLIELMAVIVILGVLAITILPKFTDLSSSARVAALNNIAGAMHSTINLVKAKAISEGITIQGSNPGNQAAYLIDFDGVSSEIDWRNLCPESAAELGDQLTMVDFINLQTAGGLSSQVNNQYTLVGYDIPGFSVPQNQGCYVIYDSFGSPDCTVTVVTADC